MSKKWNSDIMYPTDSDYVARIVGANFGAAATGTPLEFAPRRIADDTTSTGLG